MEDFTDTSCTILTAPSPGTSRAKWSSYKVWFSRRGSSMCPQKSEGISLYSLAKIHIVCKIAPSCGWLKTPLFTSWREITCGVVYVWPLRTYRYLTPQSFLGSYNHHWVRRKLGLSLVRGKPPVRERWLHPLVVAQIWEPFSRVEVDLFTPRANTLDSKDCPWFWRHLGSQESPDLPR